jgi:hypothetical protein
MVRRIAAAVFACAALTLPFALSAAPAAPGALHYHSGPSQHVAALHYTGPAKLHYHT